jgi:hypothetical protein
MRHRSRFRVPLPKVSFIASILRCPQLTTFDSGAATTASRLGQPDLAIATLNDFVGVWSNLNLVLEY